MCGDGGSLGGDTLMAGEECRGQVDRAAPAWLITFTISSGPGLTKVTCVMCDAVRILELRDRAALLCVT